MGRTAQMKAPYVSKGYMETFLNLVKRVRLSEINAKILQQYQAASPGNESKMIAALRFLKIIDQEGKIDNEKMNKLRLEGESRQIALNEIVKSAYNTLFETILDIKNATETDLKNFFISEYNYSQQQARNAAILFVYLCNVAGIETSDNLANLSDSKPRIGQTRVKKQPVEREERNPPQRNSEEEKPSTISSPPNEDGFIISIKGKNVSLQKNVKNKKELENALKMISLACELELEKE